MTFILSFGKWGGIYWHRGFGFRLCLGWIAFTFWPADIDVILEGYKSMLLEIGVKSPDATDAPESPQEPE